MNDRNRTKTELIEKLRTLRSRVAELEEKIRLKPLISTEQKKIQHALGERVKELNCLYGISEAVDRCGDLLDELLQQVADVLPGSWQYPEITCARITVGEE
ncbi:hypothetical protein LCGC14_2931790, partial [marine sediment metagenome]